MIHNICAAMEVFLYRAEKVTTLKWKQFQVHLKSAWQAATKLSEADNDRAIERLECNMHPMTPAKWKLFDILFQHHDRQPFPEVRTKVTVPWNTLAQKIAQMKTAAEDKPY
jgi:hypothetical protein